MPRYASWAMLAAALLALPRVEAQEPERVRAAVRAFVQSNDTRIVRELATLLAIPNLAGDSVNIRRNADHLAGLLRARGMTSRLLETPGAPPAVFGELRVPGATRTLMFYAHYDGQPVDSSQWSSPPWQPTLRDGPNGRILDLEAQLSSRPGTMQGEWRLYARSASDDKSPIVALLAALDALRSGGLRPSVNLKVYLEGEEEAGSPHLRAALLGHRDLLAADAWIFGDGPVHQSRRQQVVFGVRGVMGLELTTYGPARALHSGHYGNWAPNPLVTMAGFLTSLRDADGRILVAGFHDDVAPPSRAEREAIAAAPVADSALRDELQLAATEAGGAPLLERIMLPALNVRGIRGGGVGAQAANAVPTIAQASIDFRLVPRQTPQRVRSLVESHARAQGFHVISGRDPTPEERRRHPKILRLDWEGGYPAYRTDMSSSVARAVVAAVGMGTGQGVVVVPTLGGSLPLYHFEEVLGAPLITVPIVNHDNNQHAANENLRLQNLFDGIQVYAALLAHAGRLWGSLP